MKKNLLLISILVLTVSILAGCASDDTTTEATTEMNNEVSTEMSTGAEVSTGSEATTDTEATTVAENTLPVFTLEELAKYDGQNGNPVYVGYEGNVYDVSNIKEWKTGTHQGKIKAGQDLTEVLNNQAPHSSKNLTDNAPIVGTLE